MLLSKKYNKKISKDLIQERLEKIGYKIESKANQVVANRGSRLALLLSNNITKCKTLLTVTFGDNSTVFKYKISTRWAIVSPGDEAKLEKELHDIVGDIDALEKNVDYQNTPLITTKPKDAWILVILSVISFFIFPFIAYIVIAFGSFSLYQVIKYYKDRKAAAIIALAIGLSILSKLLDIVLKL